MTALAANRLVNIVNEHIGFVIDLPMGASETIYKGAFVSLDAGDQFGAPLAAGEVFIGLALEKVASAATNGADTIKVLVGGQFQQALASIAQADIGKVAFASDDNVLTLVKTSNSCVGRIVNVPATGTCIVQMKTPGEVSGAVGTTYTASAL